MNAIKFKLTNLRTVSIRYEVIYKNLARDIRKFFSQDMNENTDYIKKKRKNIDNFFTCCLQSYVDNNIGDHRYKAFGLEGEEILFVLGSLIYPKEMIKN